MKNFGEINSSVEINILFDTCCLFFDKNAAKKINEISLERKTPGLPSVYQQQSAA